MGDRSVPGSIALVLGIIALLGSLAADWLGIGRREGFGPVQLGGLAAGVALLIAAALLLRSPPDA